jgi:hypothetical protein
VAKERLEQVMLSQFQDNLSMMLNPQGAFTHIFLMMLLSPLAPNESKLPKVADVIYKS